MKNKKLMIGVCAGLAITGLAAGISGIVLANKNRPVTPVSAGDFTLTFNAGEGKFLSTENCSQKVFKGTTLEKIAQPVVQKNSPTGKDLFMGWVDENGNPVSGTMPVTRDTKLTATFTNGAIVGEYHTVTFVQQSGYTLHGNTSVAVKDATQFFMINRPEATATSKTFKGWKYAKSTGGHVIDTIVQENDKFTADTWIKPYFETAVSITWNPSTSEGGYIKHGTATTTMPVGTTFAQFQQPQVSNTDTTKYFQKWYYKSTHQPVNNLDVISADTEVVATWGDPTAAEGYSVIKFMANEDSGQPHDVTFAPSTTTVISKWKDPQATPKVKTQWSEVNRPSVTANEGFWEMPDTDCWQVSVDKKTWITLTDGYSFDDQIDYFYVRPVMVSAIKGVSIYGDENVLPENSYQYRATISGGSTDTAVWKLYSNEACTEELSEDIAEVDTNGKVTTKYLTEAKTIWLKATSNFDETKSNKIQIDISMPYNWDKNSYNKQIWFTSNKHWYYFNTSDLCENSTADLSATALDPTLKPKSIKRTNTLGSANFTETLYVGTASDFNAIPDQFLLKFSNFAGSLVFGTNITSIGNSFMEGCINFNSAINANLANITSIGDNFLYQCYSFDKPVTLKSNLTSIGDNFLSLCTSFNSVLTLPTAATSFTIGSAFLKGDVLFNQDLVIPASTTKVLDFFMTNCTSFTSTLTINCTLTDKAPIFSKSQRDISASTAGFFGDNGLELYPIYKTGFKLAGTGAAKFAEFYPTYTGDVPSGDITYRTIYDDTTFSGGLTEAQYTAAVKTNIFESTTPNFTIDAVRASDSTSDITYETLSVDTKLISGANKRVFKSTTSAGNKLTIEDLGTNRFIETVRGTNTFDSLVEYANTDWSEYYIGWVYDNYIKDWTFSASAYNSTTGFYVLPEVKAGYGHAEIKFTSDKSAVEIIDIIPSTSDQKHCHLVFSNYGETTVDLTDPGKFLELKHNAVKAASSSEDHYNTDDNNPGMGMETNSKYGFKFNVGSSTVTALADINSVTISIPTYDEHQTETTWDESRLPTITFQVLNADGTAKTSETPALELTLEYLATGSSYPSATFTFEQLGLSGKTLAATDNIVIKVNTNLNTIQNVYFDVELFKAE